MSEPDEVSFLLRLHAAGLFVTVLSFLAETHSDVLNIIRQTCRLGRDSFESVVRDCVSNTPLVRGCGRFPVNSLHDAINWCLVQRLENKTYRSNAFSEDATTKVCAITIHRSEHVAFLS